MDTPHEKPLENPSEDEFAQAVIDALQTAGDQREAVYDADDFRLNFSENGASVGVSNLRNVYDEFCQSPVENRTQRLKHLVRAMLSYHKDMPDEFDHARFDLRPIVRSRSYLEFVELQQQIDNDRAPSIPYELIGDHLIACLVYDLPEAMRTINDESLEEWGVTFYEAMEAARENLREMEFAFVGLDKRVYSSVAHDHYDASRLLMTEVIGKLELTGDPVVMVPNRDTLILTGSEDLVGLEIMADMAEQAIEAPRPMNAIPIRLVDDQWVAWFPPAENPDFARYRMLEIRSLYGEYEEQRPLLESLFEKSGLDFFISPYAAAKNERDEAFSYSIWPRDVDTVLPRAHKVFLMHDSETVAAVADWDRVQQIAGDLFKPLDYYPLRYQVTQFPSDEQLQAIGQQEA